jgi:DNA-binding protein HU-beta
MNKADLVDAIAKTGEIKKMQAEKSLSAVADAIKEDLAKGERVVLPGVGSFSCAQRKARTGRNPRTGEETPGSRPAFVHHLSWYPLEGRRGTYCKVVYNFVHLSILKS